MASAIVTIHWPMVLCWSSSWLWSVPSCFLCFFVALLGSKKSHGGTHACSNTSNPLVLSKSADAEDRLESDAGDLLSLVMNTQGVPVEILPCSDRRIRSFSSKYTTLFCPHDRLAQQHTAQEFIRNWSFSSSRKGVLESRTCTVARFFLYCTIVGSFTVPSVLSFVHSYFGILSIVITRILCVYKNNNLGVFETRHDTTSDILSHVLPQPRQSESIRFCLSSFLLTTSHNV
jgi:hypothetical protein